MIFYADVYARATKRAPKPAARLVFKTGSLYYKQRSLDLSTTNVSRVSTRDGPQTYKPRGPAASLGGTLGTWPFIFQWLPLVMGHSRANRERRRGIQAFAPLTRGHDLVRKSH